MYSLRLFGGLALEGPSGPLRGGVAQRRRLALLATLGVAGERGVSRDKLAGYLWPESDETDARHLLSDSVYVLRKALGEEAILAVGEFLRLDPNVVWCDAVAFEAAIRGEKLAEAVDLYAGPFLDGFYLNAAGEWDQWVETERRRLADVYAKALESLAERAESASDYTGAVEWWKRLAAHDPYNSRVVLRLMQALTAAGDPANALEYAKLHELRVREELGIEPPEDLRAYVERLRAEPVHISEGTEEATRIETRAPPTERTAGPTEGRADVGRLGRFVGQIRAGSLWQVLGLYLLGAWACYELIDSLTNRFGLPEWLTGLAAVLFLLGLPFVVATALVHEVTARPAKAEVAEAAAARLEARRRHRVLTWRNAGLSFMAALALWGLVAAGWVVLGGSGFLFTRAAAADFVAAEDCLAVAEFEDETERPALGATVRDAVVAVLSQSEYVTVLGDVRMRQTLGLMRLPDTVYVDQELALEIARRQNCPAVVSGSVASLGTGYSLTAAIIETETGDEVVRLNQTAADETEVVGAVDRLAWLARRHLGESLPSIRRSEPLYRHTTSSLEALRLYTLAMRREDQGDRAGAIPLLEQAVKLDTAFAEAYRKLSTHYLSVGNPAESYRNIELAYRFRDRLTLLESYRTLGTYHIRHGRRDSAAFYYRVLLERSPNDGVAINNLGNSLRVMGRFEEALQVLRDGLEVYPRHWLRAANLALAAMSLGRHALADSALAVVRELTVRPPRHLEASNALYRGDFAAVDSLARVMVNDSDPQQVHSGRLFRAGLAAMCGRMDEALAVAQEAGLTPYTLWYIEVASLAAGTPERALPYVDSLRWQSPSYPARDEYFRLGVVAYGYALAGDVRSAREILAVMDSLFENNDFHPRRGIGEAVLAVIALQEGREEDAVEHLRRARAESFGYLNWDYRLYMADAYAVLGHLDEAAAQYDTLTSTYRLGSWDLSAYFPLRPLAHERLGSLYLQVGDTAAAARHLGEFIELWNDADPELQPRVEAARRAIEALSPDG